MFFIPWKRIEWKSHSTVRRAQVFSYLGNFKCIVNLHLIFLQIFQKKTSNRAREKWKPWKYFALHCNYAQIRECICHLSLNGMFILKIRRKTNLKIVHCWCNNVKCQSWENCCLWFVEWMSACSRVYNWIFLS